MADSIADWQRTHYSTDITPAMDNKEAIVMGWAREIRKIGKLTFIKLADQEGFVQITAIAKKVPEEVIKKIDSLSKESVIAVKGNIKKNNEAPGGMEIIPNEIRILSLSQTPLPLEVRKEAKAELPTRLDARILDLRRPEIQAIFKIQAALVDGMEDWLRKNNFMRVFTPCLKGSESEGSAETFEIPYFDKKAFLREDPQLHRQLIVGGGLDRIFDTGPSWRAEKSHTIRHLCEHRGCAVELGFIRDETDIMRLEEKVLSAGIKAAAGCKEELFVLDKKIKIPKLPLPELRFPEIYNILSKLGKKLPEGEDLDRESEKLLADYVQKKYKSDFFFINRFPFAHKPFYVMQVDKEPKWARSVDLEAKGGIELSSGGQREHRYEQIIRQVKEKKINLKNLEWFTDFFRYGFPPHGGFNLGIERLTMILLDLPNIREAVLFPRDPDRLLP